MSERGDIHSGTITFVSRFSSALPDGTYEVLVGHRVTGRSDDPAWDSFDETYVSRQRIRVAGPRFRLPPDMIAAHFPPVEGTGEYEAVLPHVVLRRRTLPWERLPSPEGKSDGRPWLALLVFHDDDVPAGIWPPWVARNMPVSGLAAPEAGIVSYPDFGLEAGEAGDETCQVIDVPADLWHGIAPNVADLRWLAHGRETSGETAGAVAVVVANRMPHANRRNTVHLVSLEGMLHLLPGGDHAPRHGAVRLVSLASWGFTSVDPKRTFLDCVGALSVRPLHLPVPPGVEADADLAWIGRAFRMGYVAKSHHSRASDTTTSWYRGPLVPRQADRQDAGVRALPVPGEPVHTADALVLIDPETGMLDMGYAAAWQLGRLLMLSSTAVATELAAWKHRNLLAMASAVERHLLDMALKPIVVFPGLDPERRGHVDLVRHAGAEMLRTIDLTGPPDPASDTEEDSHTIYADAAFIRQTPSYFHDARNWRNREDIDPMPSLVSAWFGRLRLLSGVPAPYLVGDMGCLPPESLRLFDVDPIWVAALVEGAFSIGRTSHAVAGHDASHHLQAHDGAEPGGGGRQVTGCLVHSLVVADWPGLQIRGHGAEGQPLQPLRTERVTPRILLCLFDGVLDRVELREPAEGLHFGVRAVAGPNGRRGYVKPLRPVPPPAQGADRDTAEAPIPDPVPVPFRHRHQRVVDMDALAKAIETAIAGAPHSAADLALQMVEGVQSVQFRAREAG